jgi:hypothetical protein
MKPTPSGVSMPPNAPSGKYLFGIQFIINCVLYLTAHLTIFTLRLISKTLLSLYTDWISVMDQFHWPKQLTHRHYTEKFLG